MTTEKELEDRCNKLFGLPFKVHKMDNQLLTFSISYIIESRFFVNTLDNLSDEELTLRYKHSLKNIIQHCQNCIDIIGH